ncbi:HpnL family protein [soil metagenome]
MQSDNPIIPEPEIKREADPKKSSTNRNLLFSLNGIAFLIGFTILAVVIYRIGYKDLLDAVSNVGWGILLIISLNLTRHMLRAATLYIAVAPDVRTFKYRSAVAARFGGEAMTIFSFTGPFLGDATKAVLLKKNLTLTEGASAIIIDNILYYVTVILMVLSGIGLLLISYGSSSSTETRVLIAIVSVALIIFASISLAIIFRVTPLTHLIDFLNKRGLAPGFIFRKRGNILNVENNVFTFYHNRRRDFFTIFGISLGVHAISVTEVFFALKFLGHQSSVTNAFIIESLTKVINATFSFIPGTIGVYEGGNGLILSTLGYTTTVGVALALVRRGAILFSTSIGLTILIWRTVARGTRRLAESREQ